MLASKLLIALFWVMLSAFLGLIVAVLPLGLIARLMVILVGLFFLFTISITPRSVYEGKEEKIGFGVLLALIVAIILWPGYFYLHFGSSPNISAPNLLAFLLLMISIAMMFRRGELRILASEGFSETKLLSLLLLSWFLLRIIAAAAGPDAFLSVLDVMKGLIFTLGLYLGLVIFVNNSERSRVLIITILLAGLASALFGIIEFFLKHNSLSELALAVGGSDQSLALIRASTGKYRDGSFRIQATSDHPIAAGQFFGMLLFVAIYVSTFCHRYLKWLSLAMIPVSILLIYMSGSRSAYVAITIGLLFMMPLFLYRIFQSGRNSLAYILYAILATVVVTGIVAISAVMLPGFIDHLVDMDKGSSSARVEMLTRGMSAIIDKPLLGYGHGMSVYLAGMVGSDGHLTIDNYFLSMALDEGMPSLIIYFSIFVTALLFAFKMPKYLSTETPSMIYLAPAIFVFLIIQSIASLGSNQNLAITLCFIIVRGYSMRSFPSKNGPNQK